jgi:hypothetical protein
MESGFGRLVCTPGNRWQTPQTRPCRLREEASHLRQHRADQTTTMDPQKARRSDLNQWLLSEVEGWPNPNCASRCPNASTAAFPTGKA